MIRVDFKGVIICINLYIMSIKNDDKSALWYINKILIYEEYTYMIGLDLIYTYT